MGVTWLASYPRSGNTWVRVLVHAALHGSAPDSASVAATVPDLHVDADREAALTPGASFPLVKTHFMWSANHPGADRAGGAIYLIRHPRDVLLSCLNFHRVLGVKATDRAGRRIKEDPRLFARTFIERGADPVWLKEGFGPWADNCRSWMRDFGGPLLVVRYEDLRKNASHELARICDFLGIAADAGAVDRAVAASGFDQMRAMEVREKAGGKHSTFFGGSLATMRKGAYFMDRGRVGASLDDIEPGLDALFEQRFGPWLKEFWYGPDLP